MNTALTLAPARYIEVLRTIFWLTFFSIAMGYLETSVVVYLRHLYYPEGFGFPLVRVTPEIAVTEFWREFATIIMLLGAGIMAGRNPMQRFVYFLYCFAVWDIFYYVFLYVLLGWPESLLTWDILFLIPVPWVGPVLCPVLVSLTMIMLMCVTLYGQSKGFAAKLNRTEKVMLLFGCAVILTSFMWDYFQYVQHNGGGKSALSLSTDKDLFSEADGYVPTQFNWLLFWCGQITLWGGVGIYAMRMYNTPKAR
jgi:hypothetical protein